MAALAKEQRPRRPSPPRTIPPDTAPAPSPPSHPPPPRTAWSTPYADIIGQGIEAIEGQEGANNRTRTTPHHTHLPLTSPPATPHTAWVYAFDVIGQEIEAIEAQEAANKRTTAAQAGAEQTEAAGAVPHAAAANEFDEALGREGVVVYKNLLGPGQNASHVAGADVEAQEFETVADRVNFEVSGRGGEGRVAEFFWGAGVAGVCR